MRANPNKVSKNNTTIVRHEDGSLKRVTLHKTVVFEQGPLQADGTRIICLSNGGWNTVTTQTRINQCFSESKLPLRYTRKAGGSVRWYWVSGLGESFPMPPYGRCLLLVYHSDGTVAEANDSFVVVN